MKLETERLEIIPLKFNELKLLTKDIKEFEKELDCIYDGEVLEGIILDIFTSQLEIVRVHCDNYYWYTVWLFKVKNQNIFVGSACFKNSPDDNNQVEIGYGINKKYENQGYTTEAINTLCKWALEQPNVTMVFAETEKDNIASQRVLLKCNMKFLKETNDFYYYNLTK